MGHLESNSSFKILASTTGNMGRFFVKGNIPADVCLGKNIMSSVGYIEFEMSLSHSRKETELPLDIWIWNSENRLGLEKHIWESLTNKARVYQGGKKSAWDRTLGNAIPVIMEYRE